MLLRSIENFSIQFRYSWNKNCDKIILLIYSDNNSMKKREKYEEDY